jgi:hypothetical protein
VRHLHLFAIDESFPERFKGWFDNGGGDQAVCMRHTTEEQCKREVEGIEQLATKG